MHTSEKPLLSSDDTIEQDPLFISRKPSSLIHDFKLAIGLLFFVSMLVTALMRLFVPGL